MPGPMNNPHNRFNAKGIPVGDTPSYHQHAGCVNGERCTGPGCRIWSGKTAKVAKKKGR